MDYNINIFYSTVEKYVASVQMEAAFKNIHFSTYHHDFFPYITNGKVFVGYYTSRPYLKRLMSYFESYNHAT